MPVIFAVGLVVRSSRSPDDFFAWKLDQVDVDSRKERRELRTLISELRQDIRNSEKKMDQKFDGMLKKLDVVIFDLHDMSFKVKQLQNWSAKAWLTDIAAAIFRRRPKM